MPGIPQYALGEVLRMLGRETPSQRKRRAFETVGAGISQYGQGMGRFNMQGIQNDQRTAEQVRRGLLAKDIQSNRQEFDKGMFNLGANVEDARFRAATEEGRRTEAGRQIAAKDIAEFRAKSEAEKQRRAITARTTEDKVAHQRAMERDKPLLDLRGREVDIRSAAEKRRVKTEENKQKIREGKLRLSSEKNDIALEKITALRAAAARGEASGSRSDLMRALNGVNRQITDLVRYRPDLWGTPESEQARQEQIAQLDKTRGEIESLLKGTEQRERPEPAALSWGRDSDDGRRFIQPRGGGKIYTDVDSNALGKVLDIVQGEIANGREPLEVITEALGHPGVVGTLTDDGRNGLGHLRDPRAWMSILGVKSG